MDLKRSLRSHVLVAAAFLAMSCSPVAEAAECGAPTALGDGWPVASQESVGLDPAPLCALVARLQETPGDNIHGVVVVRRGKLVLEAYLQGEDQRWGTPLGVVAHGSDTLHDIRSVTKSVVALLVGIAIDRGLLAGVDAPVLDFFPEHPELGTDARKAIRARHLLAMTSGLAWDESLPYSNPANSESRMLRAADPCGFVLSQPMPSAPDKVWNYSGGSTQLLACILRRVTGKPLDAFARGFSSILWASLRRSG